jgi:hypothetical protein
VEKRYNLNFANHAPFYFESNKLKELDEIFEFSKPAERTYIIENLYYNFYEVDSKVIGDFRVGYWGKSDKKITENTKILNHDERGFFHNPWIVSYLNGLFPKKCPAEK